jgi:putative ABC transport system substrate-binding protein
LVAPLVGEAQQRAKMPRLCFITFDPGTPETPSPRFAGFFQGLRDLT